MILSMVEAKLLQYNIGCNASILMRSVLSNSSHLSPKVYFKITVKIAESFYYCAAYNILNNISPRMGD